MYVMALKNLDRWKARANSIQRKLDGISKTDEENEDEENVIIPLVETKECACSVVDGKLEPITWEEDEPIQNSVGTRCGIWRNIDGVTWIDEEGVVVNRKALNSIIHSETNEVKNKQNK